MKHIHIINTFVWREILILRRSAALLLRSGAKLLLKLSLDIITKSRRPRVNKDGGVISKQFLTLNVCHENTSDLNPSMVPFSDEKLMPMPITVRPLAA